MIIDCHAHLEPRMLDVPKALEKMDGAGVDKVVLIPAMNDLLPHTPELLLTVVRRLMRSRRTRGLAERIHRATMTKDGNVRIRGETVRIYPQPDNQAVADVLLSHPERFLGWVFLNPSVDENVLETLEYWRSIPGFVGVKLHPHWHDYETAILDPVLRRCEELRLPLLIHLGFGTRGDFRTMAARFPKLTMIAAHAGIPWFGDLWRFKNAYPNVHVDLSSPYLDEKLVRDTVAAMGPERCLYGTDAPYGFATDDGYDYGEIRRWIDRLPITGRKKDALLGSQFEAFLR
ncbi:MAG: amidohydrolase family protein [Myxococcota bacterium]